MPTSIRRAAISLAICAAAAIGMASPVSAADAPKATFTLDVKAGKLGNTIVDGKGMTLYMFVPDRLNVSNCEGGCLTAWPPMMLAAGETLDNVALEGGLRRSQLGVALRFDGSRQVTYAGRPLYWWFQDKVAGDVKGQWVNNIWFVMSTTGAPNSDRI